MTMRSNSRLAASVFLFTVIMAVRMVLEFFNFSRQMQGRVAAPASDVLSIDVSYGTGCEKNSRSSIPLEELVESHRGSLHICDSPLNVVTDTLLDPKLVFQGGRKIPRIVHVSSMSRCNTNILANNMDTWRLKDHSFFLHDDKAVERLLHREWPEFPNLKKILNCLPHKGAIMVDVWRVLVLWEYGGIYADMDTSPVSHMFNETTLDDDDAFFVVEVLGTPSQWFMAASPRHPIMYMIMNRIIVNLMNIEDMGHFPVVFTTGPGAVAEGFKAFARINTRDVLAGQYVGVGNRTATLVGEKTNQNEYITRVIPALINNRVKHAEYEKTGMTHLTEMKLKETKTGISCLQRFYENEYKEESYEPSWTTMTF